MHELNREYVMIEKKAWKKRIRFFSNWEEKETQQKITFQVNRVISDTVEL